MLLTALSELELLTLARSSGQAIGSDFAQVITITFAMVVAIFYFLHQAGIRMKIFACGMLMYLAMMVGESATAVGTAQALQAIPHEAQSLNLVYWILWLGTGYLLFFWRKPGELAPPRD